MKMEPIVSSETSATKSQTPGNYPKRNKLRKGTCLFTVFANYGNTKVVNEGAENDINAYSANV